MEKERPAHIIGWVLTLVGALAAGCSKGGMTVTDMTGAGGQPVVTCPEIVVPTLSDAACGTIFAAFAVHISSSPPRNDIEECRISIEDEHGSAVLSSVPLLAVLGQDSTGNLVVKQGCVGGLTPANVGTYYYVTSRTKGSFKFQVDALDASGAIVQSGSTSLAAAQPYPPETGVEIFMTEAPSRADAAVVTDGNVAPCSINGTTYQPGQSFTLNCIRYTCQGGNNVTATGSPCADATVTGSGGSAKAGGATGSGGASGEAGGTATTLGTGGTTGNGGWGPLCSSLLTAAGVAPTKNGICVNSDPQLCYKTCGPESLGFKSETCTAGVYVEQASCSFPAAVDYSCYKIPSSIDLACPSIAPQASTPCTTPRCVLCNVNGAYLDTTGAAKTGYCVCPTPSPTTGTSKWSCATVSTWPCPAGQGC